MKAKYKHYGNECIIYDQVICVDNIIVAVQSYQSNWFDTTPKSTVDVCLTNAEARHAFFSICHGHEQKGYECIYKEVTQ